MTDEPHQDARTSRQRPPELSVGELMGAKGVDPKQVEALAEQFFLIFKSITYAAVCAHTGQKLLAKAARIHKETAAESKTSDS